ncbi:MAG: hypothetical protein AAF311_08405 [Pseudomonadota bacterium]
MLRLLFCTVAIVPIAIIPWMTSQADTVEPIAADATYAELVTDPNIDALSECDTGELPVFFQDGLISAHSAEFIVDGLQAADGCGEVDVTIVPVLPEDADTSDVVKSMRRTAELSDYVESAADVGDFAVELETIAEPREEEISTLYMNGRAAILRIDPQDDAG